MLGTQAAVLDEVVATGRASEVVESIKLYRTLRKIKEQVHDVLMHKAQLSRCAASCAVRHNLVHPHVAGRRSTRLWSNRFDCTPTSCRPAPGPVRACYANIIKHQSPGRLASDRPNLQTVPRARTLLLLLTQSQPTTQPTRTLRTVVANVRRAFIAPPGCCLLSADYKQLELRMAAHLAGDARLRASLHQSDPFAELAALRRGVAPSQVTPDEREAVKALAYGLLYGKGMLALARDMRCGVEEARQLHDSLWAMMPRVQAWREELLSTCRGLKYVETLAGRRRPLPLINSSHPGPRGQAERQAINTVCQGSAADVVKKAMIMLHARIAAAGLRCRMIMQVRATACVWYAHAT